MCKFLSRHVGILAMLCAVAATFLTADHASAQNQKRAGFLVPTPDPLPNGDKVDKGGKIRFLSGAQVANAINQIAANARQTEDRWDDLFDLICGHSNWLLMIEVNEDGDEVQTLNCSDEIPGDLPLSATVIPGEVIREVMKKFEALAPPTKKNAKFEADDPYTQTYVPNWLDLMCNEWIVFYVETSSGGIETGSIEIDCDGDPIFVE